MLRTENLTKTYGGLEAVKDVYLEVSSGESLALLGPSGSGKTTLLRLIAGLERPDGGAVHIDGVKASSPEKMIAPSKRRLSMIFQDLALWPHMTVAETLRFVMAKRGMGKRMLEEKIMKMLARANLNGLKGRYPHELSGGEKQRLAIARALASKPAYLLMDEPFSHLDTLLKEDLQQIVKELKEEARVGILYVTHSINEALAVADRMAIINRGQIEQTGMKHEVLGHPENQFVERFLGVRQCE